MTHSQEYRKVVELSDNILVAASGDQGDVEMFVEWLKARKNAKKSAVSPRQQYDGYRHAC